MWLHVVWYLFADVSDEPTTFTYSAENSSETSVDIYKSTSHDVPEDINLHSHRIE
jgi:hypothetical protein